LFDLWDGFEQVDQGQPEADTVSDAVVNRINELDIEAKYLQNHIESDVEDRLEDLGYL